MKINLYTLSIKLSFFSIIFITAFTVNSKAYSQIKESDDVIIFGQTAALDGPASALGQGMQTGIMAAFNEVNAKGGINGKKLKLISYDDGYEPDRAIENTKRLIHEDHIFSLIGGVGTPTANAIEPITSAEKVPFIAPFTGAEFLRSPFKPYVVNIRGSYWQETEEWIERLTTDLGVKKIAILYQDDSYGRAGLSGVKRALAKRDMTLAGEATYKRNTTAVKTAVLKLRQVDPEVVVMIGAYKPCAEFIKLSKKIKFTPHFINISFVGSDALSKELGNVGDGVIISQVVPFPFTGESSQLVAEYQSAMMAANPDSNYDFVSLEGYMSGRFVIEILSHIEGPITREAFINKIYEIENIQIADITLSYGENDNQGMDQVFLTILQKDGSFLPVTKLQKQE